MLSQHGIDPSEYVAAEAQSRSSVRLSVAAAIFFIAQPWIFPAMFGAFEQFGAMRVFVEFTTTVVSPLIGVLGLCFSYWLYRYKRAAASTLERYRALLIRIRSNGSQ